MTFLVRSFNSLRPATKALYRPAAFHTSTARWAFSEDARDEEGRDDKIEKHKQDSISKAKNGNGEWKPELASQSEQIAKGDKNNMSMEEMQKMGAQKAEQDKTPAGSSSSKGPTT